ncbi:TPA: dihydrolipoyl dehydrogenase [Candidatus Woesearchaeota archaeon]|nr:dihydrolipoamide dehydrogenase [archaeon]HIJ11177.1 dihydrolipoyl dehydrogenase [Candidatus Woesearchaeota archaeon]
MVVKKYDVLVIGSGGGSKLSTPAGFIGLKAAIIEKGKFGGTCLNRGCIPSKMLIHPANVAHSIREAGKYDISTGVKSVNFEKILRRINRETDGDSRGITKWYDQNNNPTYYKGHARFVSDKVVEVNGTKMTAKRIFIATGARPNIPPIEGLKGTPYMTSTEALRARKLPKKLLVIGGGYIACELGHAYGALGADVHLIVRGETLLRKEDSEIQKEFVRKFSKDYNVHFLQKTMKVAYDKKKKKFTLSLEHKKSGKKKTITGDALLVATGVKPNTDDLGLDTTKIKTGKRGFVKVNRYMETSVKGVYALGDCVGNYMFRHSVNFEGDFLFKSLYLDKKRKKIKYPPMPHAVFSNPEVAGVGMTEDELIAKGKIKGKDYVIGLNTYKSSAMGMARIPDHGFVKLIFNKKNRKLIGAHIIGEEASDMIHQAIYAMTYGATVEKLLQMIYIHPALPEIFRNACRKALDEF